MTEAPLGKKDFVITVWTDDSPESKAVLEAVRRTGQIFVVRRGPDATGGTCELPAVSSPSYTIRGYHAIRNFFDLGLPERVA